MKTIAPIQKIEDIRGKTIEFIEDIQAEYGRTYRRYICIVFTDKTRVILIDGIPCNPKPPIEQMEKAPNFFSSKEIGERIDEIRYLEKKKSKRLEEDDRVRFNRLKDRYGW